MSIRETIQQTAAGMMAKLAPAALPDPLIGRKHGALGTSVSRVDGPLKVRGKARFAAEVRVERLTYAALLCSTIGCVRRSDAARSRHSIRQRPRRRRAWCSS